MCKRSSKRLKRMCSFLIKQTTFGQRTDSCRYINSRPCSCKSEDRNLKSCWCSTTIQNSVPALQLSSIDQWASLNKRQSLTELRVICTTDGQWRKPNSQPPAPTTKGRNQCTKIGHHERSKFRTWKFTNLENAAAWSVPAPEPCPGHPCVRFEVLNSDTVTQPV